jgi:hypothetical protein
VRRLAFVGLAAAIVGATILIGTSRGVGGPVGTSRTRARVETPSPPIRRPPTPGLLPAARRFVSAFLAYEAGETDPSTRQAIRLDASSSLAGSILSGPIAARPGHGPIRLSLEVCRLPHRPRLALVTGTARRGGAAEPFAFLLALRHGRWLAVAPAE